MIGYLAYRYSRVSHPVLKEVQQRVADVTTQAEENVVGVRVVKAFGQEANETERFRAGSERIFRQAVRAARLQALYVPALSALPSLAIAGVLLVGGYQVVHGTLTLGEFFAVNAYLLLLVSRSARWACGSASISARWRQGSACSRCWTRTATWSSGPTPARCRTAPERSRSGTWPSATRPGARCCRTSTSRSQPDRRSP